MQTQHGGYGEEGKDALGLTGRFSEQSPSQDFYVSIRLPPSSSLSLSAPPVTRWSAMEEDGDGRQMTGKDRLQQVRERVK